MTTQRIERLLAAEWSEGLDRRSDDELRAMKAECAAVETTVSFYRRLAQGRLEILGAWRERRAAGGSVEELVGDLPRILTGNGGRSSATTSRLTPADAPIHELSWPGGQERLIADDSLANLAVLDDTALETQLGELAAFERELSGVRRDLHGVLDRIEHELARRAASAAPG